MCCRYTMTKSTSVIFILMFALLFGLEQWVGSNRSYCIIIEWKTNSTVQSQVMTGFSLDCKTICIFAYSSTHEQSNKRSGTRLKTEMRLACFAPIRLLRHALPISLLILRKKPTVLQSRSSSVLSGEDYIITSTQHYYFLSKKPTFYMKN